MFIVTDCNFLIEQTNYKEYYWTHAYFCWQNKCFESSRGDPENFYSTTTTTLVASLPDGKVTAWPSQAYPLAFHQIFITVQFNQFTPLCAKRHYKSEVFPQEDNIVTSSGASFKGPNSLSDSNPYVKVLWGLVIFTFAQTHFPCFIARYFNCLNFKPVNILILNVNVANKTHFLGPVTTNIFFLHILQVR